jgi:trk system potassium uptake protein
MSRQFVIIGLGRLGSAMLDTLLSLNHEVLGIDFAEDLVQDLSSEYPQAHLVAADATEESVLKDLNVGHFDGGAVVIGENMEAGILATANLKELGVPFVVSRAISKLHGRVLERIGADRIIEPERDMGAQVARTMASPALMDYVDLGEDEALIEAEVPNEWVGKPLADLHLSRANGLAVLAVKPKGKACSIPSGDTVLNEGDVIVVGGAKEALDRSPLVQPENR